MREYDRDFIRGAILDLIPGIAVEARTVATAALTGDLPPVHRSARSGYIRLGAEALLWGHVDAGQSLVFEVRREQPALSSREHKFLQFVPTVLTHLLPTGGETDVQQLQRLSSKMVIGTAIVAKFLQNKRSGGFWPPSYLLSLLQALVSHNYEGANATTGFLCVAKPGEMANGRLGDDYAVHWFDEPVRLREDFFAEAVKHVLAAVAQILDDGLSGANQDDFRTEFLSYWNPCATGPEMISLLEPSGPSRRIAVWQAGRSRVVAENAAALRRWVAQALGKRTVADARIRPAALLWLPRPLLPTEYPSSVADLQFIAGKLGEDEAGLLDALLATRDRETVIVLGTETGDGSVLAGTMALRPQQNDWRKGFRPGRAPATPRSRDFSRSPVQRADPWWVHGRDGNADVSELLSATVGVIGCGSLGSPVARLLAQAGVGRQVLIDPETLTRANTGRHALGAADAGRSKAPALRTRLARDFPHLAFLDFATGWRRVADETPDAIERCDLLVSTIGSWSEEGELDEWSVARGSRPPIVYGWSEPFGAAGQAALIGPGSGPLACGLDAFGTPALRVAAFDDATLRREPACGAFFQPYGGGEIEAVAIMVAELALDALLDRARPGTHRLLAAPRRLVERAGGRFTPEWLALSGGRTEGGNQEETTWPSAEDSSSRPLRGP